MHFFRIGRSKYVRHEKSQRKHPVASSATSLLRAPTVPAAPRDSLPLIIDTADEAVAERDDVGQEKREQDWEEEEEKKCAVQTLLDMEFWEKHVAGPERVSAWEELVRNWSRLFKSEAGLKFPIRLENIKLQVHLF
ncbi:unnamed protein product [Diplocarpon coronariae]